MKRSRFVPLIIAAGSCFLFANVRCGYHERLRTQFGPVHEVPVVHPSQNACFLDTQSGVGGVIFNGTGPAGFRVPADDVAQAKLVDFAVRAVNGQGEAIGRAKLEDKMQAVFVHRDGSMSPMKHLPPKCFPLDLNDRGDIVGYYVDQRGGVRGFVADRSETFIDFGQMLGKTVPSCCSINNDGAIAGIVVDDDGQVKAYVWQQRLGLKILHPEAATSSVASGINAVGAVVGSATVGSVHRAFVWTQETGHQFLDDTPFQDRLDGWAIKHAMDINDRGHVLVRCVSLSKCTHFVLEFTQQSPYSNHKEQAANVLRIVHQPTHHRHS